VLVAIGFVVTVVLGLLPRFGEAVDVLTGLAREANVSSMYLTTSLKNDWNRVCNIFLEYRYVMKLVKNPLLQLWH